MSIESHQSNAQCSFITYLYSVPATCFAVPQTILRENSCDPYSKQPALTQSLICSAVVWSQYIPDICSAVVWSQYIPDIGGCTWLRHYATSRKVAGSIPDGVIGTFQ